jgi:hypothetical protein
MDELADDPSAAEVAEHLKKAPAESGLAAECFQALADDAQTFTAMHACIIDFWRSTTAGVLRGVARRAAHAPAEEERPLRPVSRPS